LSAYISEIDQLLTKLEIEFPQKPTSRILEEEKYRKIYLLRDHIIYSNQKNNLSIWEG
jgi:hypothetical protein